MKKKEMKKQKSFERDYNKIMKSFQKENVPFYNNITWINPGDFIVKFSLYAESTDSVVSTNTSAIL
jgi:hypothetical protein